MRRRELLGLFGAAALVKPSAARDQQPALPVAGVLSSLSHMAKFETAFRRGLAEMGYFDGQNVIIEYRWLEGGYDTLPQMAAYSGGRRSSPRLGRLRWSQPSFDTSRKGAGARTL